MEQAFKRHSRPQHPTLPGPDRDFSKPRALTVKSSHSWAPPIPSFRTRAAPSRGSNGPESSRWIDFLQLGKLSQGDREVMVCIDRRNKSMLFMFKDIGQELSAPCRRSLTFRHPNLLAAKHIITSDVGKHIGYDYVRCTLSEVLSIHIPLEETHIHCIAHAVSAPNC